MAPRRLAALLSIMLSLSVGAARAQYIGSGGGSPGGTNGQLQFNNNGAFGGVTMSGDATINTGTGVVTVTKAPTFPVTAESANFTAAWGNAYDVDISAGSVVCTLPSASGATGQAIIVTVINNNGTTNTLTFNTTSGQTISGQASGAMTTSTKYNVYHFRANTTGNITSE